MSILRPEKAVVGTRHYPVASGWSRLNTTRDMDLLLSCKPLACGAERKIQASLHCSMCQCQFHGATLDRKISDDLLALWGSNRAPKPSWILRRLTTR